ncbi:siderophore-interacting protein [Tomitella biformata]|uniref:siderophore-interacting protein n=1 Tax=Tomitella biformata TaxID=630403 RepID=UPI00046544E2|nr:siderophore-interacting protein [Tomitella biformata]
MARSIRTRSVYPIYRRQLEVLEVLDLTPGMRRVTLGGAGLRAHDADGAQVPEFRSTGFDDDVKLLLAHPETGLPTLPEQLDGRLDWSAESIELARTYTVREYDPAAGRVVVDFVQHTGGLAANWANSVRAGDRLDLAGPKGSAPLPDGLDWLILAGDETALPAIGRCLADAPAGLAITVVIEVAHPEHRQDLPTAADVDIRWLYRSAGSPGLAAAVQELGPRAGSGYAWAAGEANMLRPIRQHLRAYCGLTKDRVEIVGYWRQQEVTPNQPGAAARLHEITELLPPYAIRVAATLRLPGLIESGANTTAALAAATGADPRALGKLLRYLSTIDVVATTAPDEWATAAMGAVLAEEGPGAEVLDLRGAASRMDLAFAGLLGAVRTGSAAPFEGGVFTAAIESDRVLGDSRHDGVTTLAAYTAPLLPQRVDFSTATAVALAGEAAGVWADELLRAHPGLTVYLVGLPSALDRAVADVRAPGTVVRHEGSLFDGTFPAVDAIVLVDVLDEHADRDAVALLRRLAPAAETLLAVTQVLDESRRDEHDAEEDLRRLCLFGAGRRTAAELAALADAAGLAVSASAIGMSFDLARFTR